MWVKQCHVYHPPVIAIFIGDMFTIPSHEWFMALFYPHYCYCYYHHMFNQQNLLQSLVTQWGWMVPMLMKRCVKWWFKDPVGPWKKCGWLRQQNEGFWGEKRPWSSHWIGIVLIKSLENRWDSCHFGYPLVHSYGKSPILLGKLTINGHFQ